MFKEKTTLSIFQIVLLALITGMMLGFLLDDTVFGLIWSISKNLTAICT